MSNPVPPIPQDEIKENFKWRDWFRTLRSFIQDPKAVNITGGQITGTDVVLPFGAFHSQVTQSVATINTPTRVAIEKTDAIDNTYVVVGDGIHVNYSAIYNVQFSIQITNNDNTPHDLDIWIRKNGVDVPWTASVCSVVGTHGGQPGYQFNAANFFIPLNVGDYIEFWWSTNSTQVQLQALPAITTPFTSPGAPSIVVTLTYATSI
jgi:hypothetical protein